MNATHKRLKANALEILLLKQAIAARAIREQLDIEPQGAWHGLEHNHLCEHCDESWRCACDDPSYLVSQHGCDEQLDRSRRLAIALSMPSRYDAPYLSRRKQPQRQIRGDAKAQLLLANNMEIARLKVALGISA
jgi:hypothetical protein